MKKLAVVVAAALLLAASLVVAQNKAARSYQVTGPVLELTDTMIVVEKGRNKDRWEIARNKDTKSFAGLKVGDKVTVHYQMTAASIEVGTEKVKAPKGEKK